MNPVEEVGPTRLHVFIPSYQNPALLAETLDFLIRAMDQELRNGVIIATCVDDASPQSLEAVVQSSGRGQVEYLRNDTNLGIIANFNHCISLARAPFMMFLGADDLILSSYWATVEVMIQRYPEAAVYSPGVAEVDSRGRRSSSLSYFIKRAIAPFLARFRLVDLDGSHLAVRLAIGDFLYFPGLCWRTEVLRRQPLDPKWLDAADWHRLFICALEGGHLVIDNQKPVFLYRRHSLSASEISAGSGLRFENERILSRHMSRLSKEKGWWMTAVLSHLHPMVRLNAVSRRVMNAILKKYQG